QLRNHLSEKDRGGLGELIAAARAEELPSATAALLGRIAFKPAVARQAADLLEQVRRQHPNDFWINDALGRCYFLRQPPSWEDAVRYLMVAVALRPQSPGTHLDLGYALHRQRRLDEAMTAFQKAIALKPDFARAYTNLGVVLHEKGDLSG